MSVSNKNIFVRNSSIKALPKTTISAPRRSFEQKLYNRLPKAVQNVGDSLHNSIFGTQAPDITGRMRFTGGLLSRGNTLKSRQADQIFPFRLLLPKSKIQRYFQTYDPLVKSGISKTRADAIARNTIAPRGARAAIQNKPLNPTLALSNKENNILRPIRRANTINKALGALDLTGLGLTDSIGRSAAEAIARSKSSKYISDVIAKELPMLGSDIRDTLGRALRDVTDVKSVDRMINEIKFKYSGKNIENKVAQTAPKDISVVNNGLKTPENGVQPHSYTIKPFTPKPGIKPEIPQMVNKRDVKSLLKNLNTPSLDMQVVSVGGKKYFEPTTNTGTTKLKLRPSALGVPDTGLKVGDSVNINTQDLKAPGHSFIMKQNKVGVPQNINAVTNNVIPTAIPQTIKPLNISNNIIPKIAQKNVQAQTIINSQPPVKISSEGVPLAPSSKEIAIRNQGILDRNAASQINLNQSQSTTKNGVSTPQVQGSQVLGVRSKTTKPLAQATQDLSKGSSYNESLQQTILNARKASELFDMYRTVPQNPEQFPNQVKEARNVLESINIKKTAPTYKDINTTHKQLRDIWRNLRAVFGKDFNAIDDNFLEPLRQSKGDYIDLLKVQLNDLRYVTSDLKINAGSKKSRWLQMYGEGKKSKQDLVNKFGNDIANNIIKADTFFRNKYNVLLDQVNKVEQQIYPNNPEKWTPKRQNYYQHFHQKGDGFLRIRQILENPIHIDSMLAGLSDSTKPKSKWASFKQQRLGNASRLDAVGGYLDYLPSASYAINIDKNIGLFRELADILRRNTVKSKNLNNIIYNIEHFANQLSGKTPEIDRIIMDHIIGGRATLQAVSWTNRRVKANVILGNISSSIAQASNLPQALAHASTRDALIGIRNTIAQVVLPDGPQKQSIFLKERYFRGFNRFERGMLNHTRHFAEWMTTVLDEAATKWTWNMMYEKGKNMGVPDLVRYADKMAEKMVGGRGIGEKSLLQNSQMMQIIAPFQLEVTNFWWAASDIAKENPKHLTQVLKYAKLIVYLYLLNRIDEKIRGSAVTIDPIQASIDAAGDMKRQPNIQGAVLASGRLAGEVLSNVPFGQTIASGYGEYGYNINGYKLPTRKQLFGREDPTRYGTGLLLAKFITDPLYSALPPFGGTQIKKTIGGIQDVMSGLHRNRAGVKQFNVGGTPLKDTQAILFGKYSGQNARNFFSGTSYAESIYNGLKQLPKPEAAKQFAGIIKNDPAVAKAINKFIEQKRVGITFNDKLILKLGVANGARARSILGKLNALKTKQEKANLWGEMVKKKIITKMVSEQLLMMLKK